MMRYLILALAFAAGFTSLAQACPMNSASKDLTVASEQTPADSTKIKVPTSDKRS